MVKITSDWTPAVVERFKTLCQDRSLYYADIAETLSKEFNTRITKSACIGKGHRLGIMMRHSMPANGAKRREPASPKKPRPAVHHLPVEAPPLAPRPERDNPLLLEELQPLDCRWAFGDKSPYKFCGGLTVAGCSYCPKHARIAYHR